MITDKLIQIKYGNKSIPCFYIKENIDKKDHKDIIHLYEIIFSMEKKNKDLKNEKLEIII